MDKFDCVQDVIDEGIELAEAHLSGESYYVDVTMWDDGDFKVDIVHGKSDLREVLTYRSSESALYPAETFVFSVESIGSTRCATTLYRTTL